MDHICEIHVKDGHGLKKSSALLGQGDADYFGCIEVIRKHRYDGWIITENFYDQKPLSDQNPDNLALIRQDLETIRSSLA
jgi:sugar phosphate isomerase/epimerase